MHAAIPLCPGFQTKWWIVSEKKYEVLRVATILHAKKKKNLIFITFHEPRYKMHFPVRPYNGEWKMS